MAYTTIDNPELYFQCKTYSGTGSENAITLDGDENMQPDFTWIKRRDSATAQLWFDSVRGATKMLASDKSDAQSDQAQQLKSFDSDGFTVGTNGDANNGSGTFVSWNWKAGSSVSGTTTGSGTSKAYSGSVNTTSGISITKYVGNGTAGHTIPHNLGAAPQTVIVRRITESSQWVVGHTSIGFTKFLELDLTSGEQTSTLRFNDTAPTSSVFTVGTTADTNKDSIDMISYSFCGKQGFSKFGKYTGNGSATNGPFIYTGFKPAWVMQKNVSATQGWQLQDNKREGYNGDNDLLQPHDTAAESGVNRIDILSNGFKVITTDAGQNTDGSTYVYWAFAKSPFVNSNGVPTTARGKDV